MSVIKQTNSKISVILIGEQDLANLSNKHILESFGFEAKYGQTCFLTNSDSGLENFLGTLFLGMSLAKVKTYDPFYKVDFFNLGAKIGKIVQKMKIDEVKIVEISKVKQSEKPSENIDSENRMSKNLLDLQLGIRQSLWKFDKYKTNLQINSGEIKKPLKITLSEDLARQFRQEDCLKLESLNTGISLTRSVVEETPENFNPKTAVEIVKKELGNYENVEIKVRDYDWLLANGFGGVCAVGRASENKPNLVHVKLTLGENKNSQTNQNQKNITIRKATQKDLLEMFEILKKCRIEMQTNEKLGLTRENATNFDVQKSFENLQKEFEKSNSTFWLLEKESEILGFSETIQMENWVELDKLCLKKEWQNQGLGSDLLAHTLTNLKTTNQDVKVEVVSFNQKAIKFYEKFGFVKTESKLEPMKSQNGELVPAIEMILTKEKLQGNPKLANPQSLIKSNPETLNSNQKVFILHGRGGESDENFYQSVGEKLAKSGRKVEYLNVPNSTKMDSQNWLETLNQVKSQLDDKTIFITHSLGSLALARFLTDNDIRIGNWHSVAGVFGFGHTAGREDLEKHFATFDPISLDWQKINNNISQIFIHHTRVDATINFQAAKNYCQKLPKAELVVEANKYGHFGGENQFEFPELVSKVLHNLPEDNSRNTDKIMTFGSAENSESKTARENVRGVLFDKVTQKYCLVQMDGLPFFLPGGGTDGEDLETALTREIHEELGYTDFEIKAGLGKEILSYNYAKINTSHKFCSESGFLVVLNSQSEKKTQLSEVENEKKLTKVWKTSEEIRQIWQEDKDNSPQLKPLWEIFQRGVSKAIQIGLDQTSDAQIFNKQFTTRIVLIGKGLTYDTGGLDIKTDGHMKEMKCDMGGSGLMLGVMKTLAEMSNRNEFTNQIKRTWQDKIIESEKELTILGQKTEKIDNFRENVRIILFDPKTNKYGILQSFVQNLQTNWWSTLGGGIENGESYLETAKRELVEESGFVDFEIIANLGQIDCYFVEENQNFRRLSTGFLAILKSNQNIGTNLTDGKTAEQAECIWKDGKEIITTLQNQTTQDFSTTYHLELFRRGLEKLEELGLYQKIGQATIKKDWDISTLQIETERLVLKPVSMDYAEDFFREYNKEVAKNMSRQPTGNFVDTENFINEILEKMKNKKTIRMVILDKNKEFLGVVGFKFLDRKNIIPTIWIKITAQNKGFGTEAIIAMIGWAKEHLNFKTVDYDVVSGNVISTKIAKKLGGVFSRSFQKSDSQGKVSNLDLYEIPNHNYQDFSHQNKGGNLGNILESGQTLEIHWLTAFCENSVNSNSYRSDDILESFSGQTMEVWNTDAEGRLTLADVLSYGTLLEPDYMVDAATLTGACVVANSNYFTGLMGNDESLNQNLMTSFIDNNERTVTNHFPEILRESVQGSLGDLINTGKLQRQAGHITAGLFLSHFIDQNNWRPQVLEKYQIKNPKAYNWAHLDIAGTAFNNTQNALETQGATGQSVRSLVDWVLGLG